MPFGHTGLEAAVEIIAFHIEDYKAQATAAPGHLVIAIIPVVSDAPVRSGMVAESHHIGNFPIAVLAQPAIATAARA